MVTPQCGLSTKANYMGMIFQLGKISQKNQQQELGKYEKSCARRNCNAPCSLEVWIILKILRKEDLCQTKGSCQMLFATKWQSLFRCPHSSPSAEQLNATTISSSVHWHSPSFPVTQLLHTWGKMFPGEVDSVCMQFSGTGEGLCHDAWSILKLGMAARDYGAGIKGLSPAQ